MTGRGSTLGGRYRLDARIATGGMGQVWQATDTLLDREVAVKVLKSEYADDAVFRSRFQAEARHAASLHHPNVASVFDFGEVAAEDGSGASCPFLVMELVPGRPLSELLRAEQPMEPERAAHVVAQAADGIAAAHRLGIVHRDVKPANLLVTPDGRVKITDFGIARAGDTSTLTQTGQIVGTPHYISPEQAQGRSATEASDVYALGVVLYECLAGRRPFAGDTPVTTALAHLRESPPPLSGHVPLHLRRVVAKALAKDPAERFVSARDLAEALRGAPVSLALADHEPAPVTRPLGIAGGTAAPRLGGGPGWVPLAAAAAGVLLLFGVMFAIAGERTAEAGTGEPGTGEPGTGEDTALRAAAEQVRVRRARIVGMDADRAERLLERLGLDVETEDQANPGGHPKGVVAAVTPHGLVDPSTRVTLFVWAEAAEPAPREEDGGDREDRDDGDGAGDGDRDGAGHGERDISAHTDGGKDKGDKGPSERGETKSKGKAGKSKGKAGR